MTAVPSPARFWDHLDALVAQSQERVRTFHQVLGEALSRRTQLTLVVAGMRHRMDAVLPQGERLLHAFRQVLVAALSRRTQLTLLFTGMRQRLDAVLLQGEPLLRAFRQLRGNLSPRKAMLTFVAAGVVGLALIILLLEISMRNELAKEHTGAGIGATPSASPDRMAFDDAFVIQATSPAASGFVDRVGATPIPDHPETSGKGSREPVPLPRPRPKPR